MTPSLIETLLKADARRKLFKRGDAWVTAGEVRAMAAALAHRLSDGDIFAHANLASTFVACLLAAAARGKGLLLPAHTQPSYLAEIGCAEAALVTDNMVVGAGADADLDITDLDPLLTFFTSGSTDTPRAVEKSLSRLETEAGALNELWGVQASHVVATVSHQHIYGLLFRVVWPLLTTRTSDDAPAAHWENLKGRIAGATLVSSPAHLTRLPPHADLFAPPAGLIFSSGQLLPSKDARAVIETFGRPAIEVLGSTETGGIAWRCQTTPNALWTPLPEVKITHDEDGLLSVSSPFLQSGKSQQTGDVIEVEADGRFQLKPRGDRIAKVDGKRVSLARVESLVGEAAEIESVAALTLPMRRDALVAVVVLTQVGRDALAREGAFRLSRRLRLGNDRLEAAERPKFWRFVDAIPADTQGKRVLATLRALFDSSNPLDALDLDVRAKSDDRAEIAFSLSPDLIFFEGHFPSRPILPGVAQAHIAVLIAQSLWGDWPSDANLARLKFRRVLLPNDKVVLKLKRDARIGRISFAYECGDVIASQGDIGGFTR